MKIQYFFLLFGCLKGEWNEFENAIDLLKTELYVQSIEKNGKLFDEDITKVNSLESKLPHLFRLLMKRFKFINVEQIRFKEKIIQKQLKINKDFLQDYENYEISNDFSESQNKLFDILNANQELARQDYLKNHVNMPMTLKDYLKSEEFIDERIQKSPFRIDDINMNEKNFDRILKMKFNKSSYLQDVHNDIRYFKNIICASQLSNMQKLTIDKQFNIYFCHKFTQMLNKDSKILKYFRISPQFFGNILHQSISRFFMRFKKLFLQNKQQNFTIFYYQINKVIQDIYNVFITFINKYISNYLEIYNRDYKLKFKNNLKEFIIIFLMIDEEQKLSSLLKNEENIEFITQKLVNGPEFKTNNYRKQLFYLQSLVLSKGGDDICDYKQQYILNNYLKDCYLIYFRKNIYYNTKDTCKSIFQNLFMQIQQNINFCQYNVNNKIFWDNLIRKLIIKIAEILRQSKKVRIQPLITDLLYKYIKEFEDVKQMIFQTTGMKSIDWKIYNYFYYYKFFMQNKQFQDVIIPSYRKYMKHIVSYPFYSIEIQNLLNNEKKKLISVLNIYNDEKEHKQSQFRAKLVYYCILESDLAFLPICQQIFDGINVDFFLKFDKIDFLVVFLNKYISNLFKNFNFWLNNQNILVGFFRNKLRHYFKELEKELVRSVYLFDKETIKVLGKQKIILIYILLKHEIEKEKQHGTIEKDYKKLFNIYIMQLDLYIKENKESIKEIPINSEEFSNKLLEIELSLGNCYSEEDYNNKEDLLLFFFIKIQKSLSNDEKYEFFKQQNQEFLYKHYNNFDDQLKSILNLFAPSENLDNQKKCKKNKEKDEECERKSMDLQIYETTCPFYSKKFGAESCLIKCPENFPEQGLYCIKPLIIFRKVYRTENECGKNCQVYDDDYYIIQCPNGYSEYMLICIPKCPFGAEDMGKSCKRNFVKKYKIFYQLILQFNDKI